MKIIFKCLLVSFFTVLTTLNTFAQDTRTPISTPMQITQSGSYVLTNNIAASNTALNITASDVTIDLNGFTISQSGSQFADGIVIVPNGTYPRNISIINGSIKGFTRHGIFVVAYGSTTPVDLQVKNLRVLSNGSSGVRVEGFGYNIEGSVISGNGGLGIYSLGSGLILNNVISHNGYGIVAYGNPAAYANNTIFGNTTSQVTGNLINLGKNMCGAVLCP
jgi:hypothetical protein